MLRHGLRGGNVGYIGQEDLSLPQSVADTVLDVPDRVVVLSVQSCKSHRIDESNRHG